MNNFSNSELTIIMVYGKCDFKAAAAAKRYALLFPNRAILNRSAFSRELKKTANKRSGQGTDDNYTSNWEFFDALKFIRSSLTGDPTESNLNDSSTDNLEPPTSSTDTISDSRREFTDPITILTDKKKRKKTG
ncbi:hypothetical protein RN001_000537 [Aquatica leii]|uniref:DUF4817 domain-containing protein n=1 Tax=Aquatica leii TaxID=1421715 RepID=A0AAN7SCA3_9COLE|nr:hypothetical protein RN001_000537 [Aquatica leii]